MSARIVFMEPSFHESNAALWDLRLEYKYPSLLKGLVGKFEVAIHSNARLGELDKFRQLCDRLEIEFLPRSDLLAEDDPKSFKSIEAYGPDLISNLNGRQLESAIVALRAAEKVDARHCWRIGGDDIATKASVIDGFYRRERYVRVLNYQRTLCRDTDMIIVMSERERRRLAGITGDDAKIRVVHRGIDLSLYKEFDRKIPFSEPRDISIVYLGRNSPEKGVDTAEQIARLISSHGLENVNFKFYGDFPQAVEDNRVYYGKVAQADVPRILLDADAVILPSRAEGMPNTLMEAMAAGRVVIASSHLFVHELPSDAAVLAEANAEQFFKAILGLLSNPETGAQVAVQGRRFAEHEFADDRCASTYVSVLSEALNR